jgi:hypothetical protein
MRDIVDLFGLEPILLLHVPIYLGGFTPNTFSRITKYDLNGWLFTG